MAAGARPAQPSAPPPCHPPLQVESHFIQGGYLLPAFHKHYWLGIRAATWGAWKPLDQQLATTYLNWHTGQPNGLSGPQLCTVANASANGTVGPAGWGYADVLCSGTYVYICRIAGGARQLESQLHPVNPVNPLGRRSSQALRTLLRQASGAILTSHELTRPLHPCRSACHV